jgi:hypothetical protein
MKKDLTDKWETDVFLKDEGEFVTIGFESEKAQKVMRNDNMLNKLSYTIGDGKLPKVDFPMCAIQYIRNFLIANNLAYVEC